MNNTNLIAQATDTIAELRSTAKTLHKKADDLEIEAKMLEIEIKVMVDRQRHDDDRMAETIQAEESAKHPDGFDQSLEDFAKGLLGLK